MSPFQCNKKFQLFLKEVDRTFVLLDQATQVLRLGKLLQGWAMRVESHGICLPGHESRDLGPGLGLIFLSYWRQKTFH